MMSLERVDLNQRSMITKFYKFSEQINRLADSLVASTVDDSFLVRMCYREGELSFEHNAPINEQIAIKCTLHELLCNFPDLHDFEINIFSNSTFVYRSEVFKDYPQTAKYWESVQIILESRSLSHEPRESSKPSGSPYSAPKRKQFANVR